jgi:hypothetical protein
MFCYGCENFELKAGEGAEIMGHAFTSVLTFLESGDLIQNILNLAIN